MTGSFFAAILAVKNGQYKAIGLWFEHKKNNDNVLSNYVVSIDDKTGKAENIERIQIREDVA